MARGVREKEKGRGPLSSIDMLPPEARDDIDWADDQLRERSRTQLDIFEEFNDRLKAKGIGPISSSAFNRHSTRMARNNRFVQEINFQIAEAKKLTKNSEPDALIDYMFELFKEKIYNALDNENMSSKQLLELTRAFATTLNARNNELKLKKKADAEKAQSDKGTDAAAAAEPEPTVEKQAGLDKETIARLRREFLGVKEPVQDAG